MKLPTITHKVKKGENLTKICKDRGFANGAWKKLYNATYNKKLKKLRPDPNLIKPGDELIVPILSKAQIIAIVDGMWIVIYAKEDKLDLYRKLLKDLGPAKKKVAKDEEAKLEPLRKLNLMIMNKDAQDRMQFKKCRAEAKKSLLGDFMGTCEATFKAYENINMNAMERALVEMGKQEAIAKVKLKALAETEKQVKANIAALEKVINDMQNVAMAIGKSSHDSF